MHDIHSHYKANTPSRMRKYYSGEILFCTVLMCYVSQNIVAITGTLRLNRLTLLCQEPTSLQASSPIWASEEPEW